MLSLVKGAHLGGTIRHHTELELQPELPCWHIISGRFIFRNRTLHEHLDEKKTSKSSPPPTTSISTYPSTVIPTDTHTPKYPNQPHNYYILHIAYDDQQQQQDQHFLLTAPLLSHIAILLILRHPRTTTTTTTK